ncbi:uncharacterized protein METZ01_LOCUS213290, partial [marine metagenome]
MEFSTQNIIFKSWQTLKRHLGLWILIMLFIFAFNIAVSAVQEKLLEDITVQTVIFIIAAYLFQAGINLGMLKIALNIYNNVEPNFMQIFGSFHLLLTYVLATVIFLLLLVITASPGIIFLVASLSKDFGSMSRLESLNNLSLMIPILLIIIPIVYSSIRMQFYDYFLIDGKYGAIDAIKRSTVITKGYVGKLF